MYGFHPGAALILLFINDWIKYFVYYELDDLKFFTIIYCAPDCINLQNDKDELINYY